MLLILITSAIYFALQVESIYGGDAGDLVSAIIVSGVAHPPGYPLYTMLGILLTKVISFGTIAYRVGFLSSIPGILTLIILYDLIVYLSQRYFIAFLTSLLLAFTYHFWLYSEVVEVFSLNNFFLVLLLSLSIHYLKEKKSKYIFLIFFVLGLSLSHHHIILFLLPSVIFLIWQNKQLISLRHICLIFIIFLIGLIFYLYPVVSSLSSPSINWQGPPTFRNFFDLVARIGYGTFRVGSATMHDPILRFLSLWAFFDFFFKDFRILGIILFVIGFISLFRFDKKIFTAIFLGILSYLFFLFYASFPLTENFSVATYERFIQPLYILMTVVIAFGLILAEKILSTIINRVLDPDKSELVLRIALFCFLIYPAGLFIQNFPKISILKRDFTAEKLGEDILNSVPPDSILIISTDNPLFDTQYVYYSQKKWPKVKLVHLSKLYSSYYYDQLKKDYPQIEMPEMGSSPHETVFSFIEKNYGKFPIYSKLSIDSKDGIWVPYGLLFRYVEKSDTSLKETEVISENERLWASYHDPLSGSLSQYKNLMLSDVLKSYSVSCQEIGYWAAKKGYYLQSENHLLEAQRLDPRDVDSYVILSQVYLMQKKCEQAKNEIDKIGMIDRDDSRSDYLQSLNYAVCFKDKEKAAFYEKLFEEKRRGKETPLKKL